MTERAEQVRQILHHLIDGRDRWGASLVSRDGIVASSQMSRPVSEDSFSAMAAAALGAAEGAMSEWADDRPRHATFEGLQVRLTLEAIDNDFFLAVATPLTSNPIQTQALEIEAAATRLRNILKTPLLTTENKR
jgi:predicted regulator of Ras-like GTPase activity (Roadblock/LC7/MglB family)